MNAIDTLMTILRNVIDLLMASGVPADVLRGELDEAAIRRANMAADAAELAKFGGKP